MPALCLLRDTALVEKRLKPRAIARILLIVLAGDVLTRRHETPECNPRGQERAIGDRRGEACGYESFKSLLWPISSVLDSQIESIGNLPVNVIVGCRNESVDAAKVVTDQPDGGTRFMGNGANAGACCPLACKDTSASLDQA